MPPENDPIADIARELLKANQVAVSLLAETTATLSLKVENLGAVVGELKDRLHSSPCAALTDHAIEARKVERFEANNRFARHWQVMLLLVSATCGGLASLFVQSLTKGSG